MSELVKNEFNETWVKVEDEELLNKFKRATYGCEDDRFWVDFVAEVVKDEVGQDLPNKDQPNKHWVVGFHAGRNGDGEWNEYFLDAISIVNRLTKEEGFKSAYLIDWINDCADDVSWLRIGVTE